MKVSRDAAAEAALAYAIWDAENSTRMDARQIDGYIARARLVLHWLDVHGHEVRKKKRWDSFLWLRAKVRRIRYLLRW